MADEEEKARESEEQVKENEEQVKENEEQVKKNEEQTQATDIQNEPEIPPAPEVVKKQALNWIKHAVTDVAKLNHIHSVDEVLRGSKLAEAWHLMDEDYLKEAVKKIIVAKWKLENWWDEPPGKSASLAKEIYETKPKEDEVKNEENKDT